MTVRILAFAGSTRSESYNKKLVRIAVAGARGAGAEVTLIDLRDYPMPLYDGDLEAEHGLPENAHELRKLFLANDGLLIACPEYNSSISGVLKNTIDWLSRRQPNEPSLACFLDKVAALTSASPGNLGGLRGLFAVRSILSNIKVLVLSEQVAVSQATEAFAPDSSLRDKKKQAAVEALGAQLARVIAKLRG